jgi:hypothetical protein
MDISNLITNVGFPIASCIAMGWYFVKFQKQNNDTIDKLSQSLNNNTIVLTKLSEKIDSWKEGQK